MGNKGKHLKHIIPCLPEKYNRYVEPFLGTGAVFLAIKPKKFIINDLNQDVMDTWKTVRDYDPRQLLDCFHQFGDLFRPRSCSEKLEMCNQLVDIMNRNEQNDSSLKLNLLDKTIFYVLLKYCAYMGTVRMKNRYAIKGIEYNIYKHNRYSFLTPEYELNLNRQLENMNIPTLHHLHNILYHNPPYNFYNFYKTSQKFKQYLKENAKRLNCGFDMNRIKVDDQIELLEMGFEYKPTYSIIGYSHVTIDVFSGKDYQAEYRTRQYKWDYFLGDYDKLLNYLIEKKDKNFIKFLKDLMKKFPENVPEFQIKKFQETIKKLNIIPTISRSEFLVFLSEGNVDMVKLALDNKMIQLVESDSNLLFDATQRGYTEIVELLLKNPKIDVNYKNCKSLIYAAYYDYVDIVKILLSRPEIEFDPQKTLKYADDESRKIIEDYLENKK
jgi:site-specific DNA-adenine methylase